VADHVAAAVYGGGWIFVYCAFAVLIGRTRVGAGAAVRWLAFNLRSLRWRSTWRALAACRIRPRPERVFSAERLGPRATPYGESQPLYRCRSKGGDFLLLCRHGEAGYEVTPNLINYRANIYALRDLDVVSVVSCSETRAISHNYKVGQFVVVDDLIDETISRPTTFFANKELGHIRHWPVFCPNLRKAFVTALEELKLDYSDRGVYVCIEGPRQETPAEAHKYEVFGGELIGRRWRPRSSWPKSCRWPMPACASWPATRDRYALSGVRGRARVERGCTGAAGGSGGAEHAADSGAGV
jgi:purine nucleoside phosphorylase